MSNKEKLIIAIGTIFILILYSPMLIAIYKMWVVSFKDSLDWNGVVK